MKTFFCRQWFLIAILVALVGSFFLPALPVGDYQFSLKLGLVATIFFTTGLGIRSRELGAGLGNWPLHLFVQAVSFIVSVAIALCLDRLWALFALPPHVRLGFLVLAALPTTITGCVVLTTAAKGNVSGAVVNACLGNLLGVFITPLWIWYMNESAQTGLVDMEFLPVLQKLCWFVLLPLIIGQIVQWGLGRYFSPTLGRRASVCGQLCVVGIVYVSFQDAFAGELVVSVAALVGIFFASLLFYVLLVLVAWFGPVVLRLGFDEADRRCALMCASQKTLAFGLPLIALCFAGHPQLALISLPVLVYHPLQLIVAGWLAARLCARITTSPM